MEDKLRKTTLNETSSLCSALSAGRRLTRDVRTTTAPVRHSNVIKFTVDYNDKHIQSNSHQYQAPRQNLNFRCTPNANLRWMSGRVSSVTNSTLYVHSKTRFLQIHANKFPAHFSVDYYVVSVILFTRSTLLSFRQQLLGRVVNQRS